MEENNHRALTSDGWPLVYCRLSLRLPLDHLWWSSILVLFTTWRDPFFLPNRFCLPGGRRLLTLGEARGFLSLFARCDFGRELLTGLGWVSGDITFGFYGNEGLGSKVWRLTKYAWKWWRKEWLLHGFTAYMVASVADKGCLCFGGFLLLFFWFGVWKWGRVGCLLLVFLQ